MNQTIPDIGHRTLPFPDTSQARNKSGRKRELPLLPVVFTKNHLSECYTRLKNSDLPESVFFIVDLFTPGNRNHVIDKTPAYSCHLFPFDNAACIEINPSRFVGSQCIIGRYFHRGHIGTERCTTTCGKQHHLTTARSQCRCRYQIVSRSTQQIQPLCTESITITQHIAH